MSGRDYLPSRENLDAIVETTARFLELLRDAGLIVHDDHWPTPDSTRGYRKNNAVHKWLKWERMLNPSGTPFGFPPTESAAGGWREWEKLHLALVDLYALRSELITHWGLEPIIGTKSVRISFEGVGAGGKGQSAQFICPTDDSGSGDKSGGLEKELDWPPPLPLDWLNQCLHALEGIRQVINSESNRADGQDRPRGHTMSETKAPAGMSPVNTRDHVFISYSHKDAQFRDQLLTHLKPLTRSGSVTAWSDQQIAPGSKWFEEIKAALERTKVAVLLVTPSFLASDFIHEHELTPLLKEVERGGVQILWIPIRACSYAETPLKKYQAIGDPSKPLAEMKAERDKAWVRVCNEIKTAVAANMNEATSGQGDGNKKRIAGLIETMKDPEADIRKTAIRKLGEIGPPANQAIGPLIQAFQDSSEEVRSEAGEAVLKLGPLAIPLLVDCLIHVDPGVRARAACLLGLLLLPQRWHYVL